MNPFSLCILLAFTLTAKGIVYGQSKNHMASFPTYNQLKPEGAKIFDYVPERGSENFSRQKVAFKLFDYPNGSVTYILNGKSTTNADYVKKVINQNGNRLNSISIGEPAADGKRVISLIFSTEK